MSRLLLTAAVLAVLVYTMVLGVQWLSPRIEQDIAGRVTTGLAEQGLLWADVAVKGRDVVLSGEAPTAEDKAKAVNVATRVFGVSNVQDQLTVVGQVSGSSVVSGTAVAPVQKEVKVAAKTAVDYSLTILKAGESIAFEGNVPDESSKKVLIELATNRYGVENVDGTKLVVVEGAPAGWRSAVGAVLMHISNLEQANVVVNGNEVMISGTVIDKDYSDKMEADVNQVLPKEYKVAFAVDVVTPTVPVEVEPAAGEETAAATGCDMAEAEKQVLLFGFDKADLTAEHATQLKVVEKALEACAEDKMVIAGYTDVTGSKLYNKWLSQQRAEATQRKLMRDGVAKDRLRAVGYGDLHPIADNKTRDGRAKNRRVEFHAGAELPYAEGAMESKKAAAKVEAKPEAQVVTPVEAKVEALKAEVKAEAKKGEANTAPKVEAVKVDVKKVAETVKVKTVSATQAVVEKVDAAVVEPAAGAVDAAADKASGIAKPWWASKTVSETAVEVK
jgi:outer membrane protein OmpA-like peptidoglycan-associated protein